MHLPYSLSDTLHLLCLAKDEEELLALLRTRSVPQLFLFFTAMAEDESWCEKYKESAHLVLQRLSNAFLVRQLPLDQARLIAQNIRHHYTTLLPMVPQDLLCLIEGQGYPMSSLLLGAESRIVRDWLQYPEIADSSQKAFAFGAMSLQTYRCLEECLTKGGHHTLSLSTLEQMQHHLIESVSWELETFRPACLEVLVPKLHIEELEPFLALSMRLSLQDLKQLCCRVWNDSDSAIELEAEEESKGLGLKVHSFHLSQWPRVLHYAPWITRLIFCGNTASHALAKELVGYCKNVVCYDLSRTESCDDALMEFFFSAQELRLASCSWLDDEHVEQLFLHVKRLTSVDLSNNPQITKQAWNRLKQNEGIQKLCLTYYHIAQEKELLLILLLLASRATSIDLSWSSGVHDRIIKTFISQNEGILHLYLAHCENITDTMLGYLLEHLHSLHTLDISGNPQFSEEAIEGFVFAAPSLRVLDVRRREMSSMTLARIKTKRPDLTVVF